MKQTICILCLTLLALTCPALDRFVVLARVESATKAHPEGDDMAVGKDGERGRFQAMEYVWKGATNIPFAMATNAATALAVAQAIQAGRTQRFVARWKRQPNDAEFYLLYHRPATVLGGRKPTAKERERATRFANLVNSK